jgi:hypothetical protein
MYPDKIICVVNRTRRCRMACPHRCDMRICDSQCQPVAMLLLLLLGSTPRGAGRGGSQHLGGESLQRRRGLKSRGSCCPNFWDVAVGVDCRLHRANLGKHNEE